MHRINAEPPDLVNRQIEWAQILAVAMLMKNVITQVIVKDLKIRMKIKHKCCFLKTFNQFNIYSNFNSILI